MTFQVRKIHWFESNVNSDSIQTHLMANGTLKQFESNVNSDSIQTLSRNQASMM